MSKCKSKRDGKSRNIVSDKSKTGGFDQARLHDLLVAALLCELALESSTVKLLLNTAQSPEPSGP